MTDLPAPPWGYFLDLDGTLVDLAETPAGALAPEGLPTLLERLHAESGGALALVSGRPIAELDALLGGLHLPAAGLHGLERRTSAGRMVRSALDTLGLDPAWDTLAEQVARHPGLLAERKGIAFAIHYQIGRAHV